MTCKMTSIIPSLMMLIRSSSILLLGFGLPTSFGFHSHHNILRFMSSPPMRPHGSSRLNPNVFTENLCKTSSILTPWMQQQEEDTDDSSMGTTLDALPSSAFGSEVVPSGQLPANEYLNLITSPLFGWANQQNGDWGLAIRLGITYLIFYWLICFPISSATFIQEGYTLHKISASNVGALGVIFILLIRLYSGWGYVGSRLTSKVIEYEKTGWYDGDFEEKGETEKARDLFLYRQNVKPVEDRIKKFTLVFGVAWVASCIALNGLLASKPIFNEYDPAMLERLVYDEKLAGVAASQSAGRPTYCENRYYRAIANGGQGCN